MREGSEHDRIVTVGCSRRGARGAFPGGGPQRTRNIPYMLVTREVSQLEMSALKFLKSSKSMHRSVMAETSQLAMGPYVASAEAGFASKAQTASFRESLLVNL